MELMFSESETNIRFMSQRLRQLLSKRILRYDVILESINTVPFFSPLFTKTPVVGQIYSIENKSVLFQEMKLADVNVFRRLFIFIDNTCSLQELRNHDDFGTHQSRALFLEGFRNDRSMSHILDYLKIG